MIQAYKQRQHITCFYCVSCVSISLFLFLSLVVLTRQFCHKSNDGVLFSRVPIRELIAVFTSSEIRLFFPILLVLFFRCVSPFFLYFNKNKKRPLIHDDPTYNNTKIRSKFMDSTRFRCSVPFRLFVTFHSAVCFEMLIAVQSELISTEYDFEFIAIEISSISSILEFVMPL